MSYANSNVKSIIAAEPMFKKAVDCYAITSEMNLDHAIESLSEGIDTSGLDPVNPNDNDVASMIADMAKNQIRAFFAL